MDPARNNYSGVDVDVDGAIQTSLFGANASERARGFEERPLFSFLSRIMDRPPRRPAPPAPSRRYHRRPCFPPPRRLIKLNRRYFQNPRYRILFGAQLTRYIPPPEYRTREDDRLPARSPPLGTGIDVFVCLLPPFFLPRALCAIRGLIVSRRLRTMLIVSISQPCRFRRNFSSASFPNEFGGNR